MIQRLFFWLCCCGCGFQLLGNAAEGLRVGVFKVDASPPIGSPLAYDPCVEVTDPLTCRGIVLVGAEQPIVIAAIDWIGIANDAHTQLRQQLATAVGTDLSRVAVHTLHQHDAPGADFSAAMLLEHYGSDHQHYDVPWTRDVFARASAAAAEAVQSARSIDAVGTGSAEVKQVASNRRLLGDDGKVVATRFTACRDPEIRAMPTGTIDPLLRTISLWNGNATVVVMTYYATHPQSYYRTGKANPDFPGYARNARERETGIPHIHFNGAGGNIGAGKWNDGSPENRPVLAGRVANAMQRAWESTEKHSLTANEVEWETLPVYLPIAEHLTEAALVGTLEDTTAQPDAKQSAARHLAWLRRSRAGDNVELQCLALGPARVLYMPGELFVEYQLAAADMRPDLFVVMAAYGDYGPGYIGTEIAYSQGGYETSPGASRVAPQVEGVLTSAMKTLLE